MESEIQVIRFAKFLQKLDHRYQQNKRNLRQMIKIIINILNTYIKQIKKRKEIRYRDKIIQQNGLDKTVIETRNRITTVSCMAPMKP